MALCPVPGVRQQSPYALVLLAVQRRLRTAAQLAALGPMRVWLVTEGTSCPKTLAEDGLRVRPCPGGWTPTRGRFVTRGFAVGLLARFSGDDAGGAERHLPRLAGDDPAADPLDPAAAGGTYALDAAGGLGHLRLEDLVLDALDLWPPTADSPTTALTVEPLHAADGGGDVAKPKPGEGFAASSLYFEARFVQPLSLPDA